MTAGKYHSVLSSGKANDTLALVLVCDVCCSVVNAVDVVQIEYCIVVLRDQSRERLTRNFCFKNLYFRLPGASWRNCP